MTRTQPYRDLDDYQLWRRAVTWAPPGGLDPVVAAGFRVSPDDKIATVGSCFAQHISRHLAHEGFNYFVVERGDHLPLAEAKRRNFGVYSARYGNVYTVAQAVQLLRRAFGTFTPVEAPWKRDEACFDPFRPQIEPDGFPDEASLLEDRAIHLAAVRSVFQEADVVVFTLGLTEAWRSRADGAVFPVAPGVAAGTYDPDVHEFTNFGIDEVRQALFEFCDLLRSINPSVRILLTVSPVPLVATYEPRHVLVSTTYSKSVLRVAADEAAGRFSSVDYFPSYEIISAASAVRNYYRDDLREVVDLGVNHVMRCFDRHYVKGVPWRPTAYAPSSAGPAPSDGEDEDVVCDEELVAAAVEASRIPVRWADPVVEEPATRQPRYRTWLNRFR